INFVVLVAPLVWVFFQSRERPGHRNHALCLLTLAIGILLFPRAHLILQVADHTAIAFGIFSCWFLTKAAVPTSRHLLAAAGAMILAVWAKQIEVFLIVAQLAYLFIFTDRLAARNYML